VESHCVESPATALIISSSQGIRLGDIGITIMHSGGMVFLTDTNSLIDYVDYCDTNVVARNSAGQQRA
jgi:hypothetical protein